MAWTASRDNIHTPFYFERADGSYSWDNRILYWYGIKDLEGMGAFIKEMIKIDAKSLFSSPHASKPDIKILKATRRDFSTFTRSRCDANMNFTCIKTLNGGKRQYSTSTGPKRIGIIGARGHTGQELIKLIDANPDMELAYVSSRELAGQSCVYYKKSQVMYSALSPSDCAKLTDVDLWVLALPNGICKPFVAALDGTNAILLDLSADYRFDSGWLYGLPELYSTRSLYKKSPAKKISNPGCYATASQLALAPLHKLINARPSLFGVSGYSGAGTTPSRNNDLSVLKDNLIPYKLMGHIHEREVGHHSGTKVNFMPHVAPYFSGISLTCTIPLSQTLSSADIYKLFHDFYAGEALIRVGEAMPEVKTNSGRHFAQIGGFFSDEKRVAFVVTIDNLLKGAATQAMQNMNLALGIDEMKGIPL